MDGPIASSLQLVRSAVLLLTVLAGARNLIAIGFEGPLDLDEQRRGWIAAVIMFNSTTITVNSSLI